MPLYETIFIARQDVTEKHVKDMASKFATVIKDNGGELKNQEDWGLRTLAYKINKNRKGHYTLMHFDAPAKAMAEMERQMKLNEDVLRHMTLRMEELPEGPSYIMKSADQDN